MSSETNAFKFLKRVQDLFIQGDGHEEENWKLFLATVIGIQKVQKW